MLDLAQIGMLRHQRFQFVFGAVARTVIDIDDLEIAARQGARDFLDKRLDIAGFIANRHDDGNVGHSIKAFDAAFYWARIARASALMRGQDGPGFGMTCPSSSR